MAKPVLAVLTGAGISAESGLKTFRDSDGLWEGYRVEDVATPEAFEADPARVLRFYNERRRQVAAAQPNEAHRILGALEDQFDVRVVTQNIDDLHERGGSTRVLHLHGEIFRKRSAFQDHDDRLAVPERGDMALQALAPDGGLYRPHIVWFGEAVPALYEAAAIMRACDAFLLVGSSLAVYPAAGLIHEVPAAVPKFVVDRRMPDVSGLQNLTAIELPATEGLQEVRRRLFRQAGLDV